MTALRTAALRYFRRGTRRYALFDGCVWGAVCCLAVAFVFLASGQMLLQSKADKLAVMSSTVITDRNGSVVGKLSAPDGGNREQAAFGEMPKLLIDAFVAAEDARFYSHNGFDPVGLARAAVADLRSGRLEQGGSTITMQLARTVFLDHQKSFLRKLNEIAIAAALEQKYTKNELMAFFLNHTFFGRGQVGVKAAAERYFGISDLTELQLWQMATLAAVPKGPSVYNPVDDYGRSRERRNLVLALMHEQGYITQEQMLEAQAVDYRPPAPVKSNPDYAAYIDYAVGEASRVTGLTRRQLTDGGYTIVTEMDPAAQQAAAAAFKQPDNFPKDGANAKAQGAFVVLDNRTSELRALIGGRDYKEGDLNRALQPRQPGSAFKPIIVYGPALQSGSYSSGSLLQDAPVAYGNYRPTNANGRYSGSITMADAIRDSVNAPAVWLLNEVGIGNATQFAERLGIKLADDDRHLAIALGGLTEGVSPLDMAQAYGVFARGGIYNDAHAVRMVKDPEGRIVYRYQAKNKRVMSSGAAQQMTAMLREVVANGTGRNARLKVPVAGKTGTTQLGIAGANPSGNRDIWFVGFTPQLTAAVWMGFDRTTKEDYISADSGLAARLFGVIMGRLP